MNDVKVILVLFSSPAENWPNNILKYLYHFQKFYLSLRQKHRGQDCTPITTRQLESLIRLTEVPLWTHYEVLYRTTSMWKNDQEVDWQYSLLLYIGSYKTWTPRTSNQTRCNGCHWNYEIQVYMPSLTSVYYDCKVVLGMWSCLLEINRSVTIIY